jgi:hypothetical protein
MAQLSAMWVDGNVADQTTKDVCTIALKSVGLLGWNNGMAQFSQLLPGNQLNTVGVGCVCYEAPVAFALMGNALSIHECNAFFALSQGGGNANARLLQHIYGRIQNDIREWQTGDQIPAGAMVFHGDHGTPCRHVTLGVGNGNVVSCWGPAQAAAAIAGATGGMGSIESRIYLKQVEELQARRLSPDTVVVPETAFTTVADAQQCIHYTNGPFWTFW